jgi:hypothetical protein
MIYIYRMLSLSKMESTLQDESLWSNLSTFLHEWIRYMKKESNPTDIKKLKKASKSARSLIDKINREYPNSQSIPNHLSINLSIDSTVRNRIRNDPQFQRIFNYFNDKMPDPLIEIIGGYNVYHYDKTIIEFLDRIMNDLGVSPEKRNNLDLYSSSFASWFLSKVKEKMDRFPIGHYFWYDLDRFLFKWILTMRRILADDDQAFQESVADIDPIIITSYKNGFNYGDESVSQVGSI